VHLRENVVDLDEPAMRDLHVQVAAASRGGVERGDPNEDLAT
jgi:hypothetical protein